MVAERTRQRYRVLADDADPELATKTASGDVAPRTRGGARIAANCCAAAHRGELMRILGGGGSAG
jgi:hypothetical protein